MFHLVLRLEMRSNRFLAIVLCALASVGCSAGSPIEGLHDAAPSGEKTGSIVAPLIPRESVGVASVGYTEASTLTASALVSSKEARTPAFEQVAMVAPKRAAVSSSSRLRSRVVAQRFGEAKPIDFGKVTPQDHLVHGVDVSRWQGEIDWETLRDQGANFAFIKATDGGDYLDPMFRANWRGAREAGLKRGAYHFFYWCRTGKEQADWFIRSVPKEAGALPPVIDVEWNDGSRCARRPTPKMVREKMQDFMNRLERYYGQRPIIYATPDFYEANLKSQFRDYPFWLRSVAAHPSVRYPGREWVFWQYSGTGLSKGVRGKIDLNVFRGDEAAWHRWLAQNLVEEQVASK